MDKIYHFQKPKQTSGNFQVVTNQGQSLQFFSEDEMEKETAKIPISKTKLSSFASQLGYQTDKDSEGETPPLKSFIKDRNLCNQMKTSKILANKMSKFRNLVNTKQIEGDVENEPDFDEQDIKKSQCEEIKLKEEAETDLYNIKEQEQKIKQRLKENPQHKLTKYKNNLSQQNLLCQSDVESKKNKASKDESLSKHPYRHLIFGPNVNEAIFKKYLLLTQRGLVYARKCLKGPSDKFIKSKQISLPEAPGVKKDKTLVLDLDETLIHSCPARENPQVYVTAIGDYGEEAKIGINVRPYCQLFLQRVAQYYTIYIYTASSAAYASAIISYLDPKKQYIAGILTRSNCMETKNGFFIKDLRIICNKQLKDILIVDNLSHSFGFQIENGIPILEYHNDQYDEELKYLTDYLIHATQYNDLREYNKRLKLNDLIEFNLDQ